jgi:hypothetical protein
VCSETRKRCVLEREFDSPCVINDVNTNRLRYADHMIRRPEDLPQKEDSEASYKEDRNLGERMGWIAIAGPRLDAPSSGQRDMELLCQALTSNGL